MIGLLAFAGVFVAIKWKKTGKKRMKRLLGPTPWLVTGNLLQLEEDPHIILTKSREKYGDMFQTKLGSMPMAVLHGVDTFKQALEIQGENSVDRSDLYSFSLTENEGYMTFNKKYREGWDVHKEIAKNAPRKLSSRADQNLTCSCLLQEHIYFEVSEIVRAFRDLSDTAGSFDFASFLTRYLASVICNLCFGKRYNQNDKEFLTVLKISHEVMQIFSCSNAADVFPAFHHLPDNKRRCVFTCLQNKERFHRQKYQELSYDQVRSTTEDTILNGYFIPRDTCVFISQSTMDNIMDENPGRFVRDNCPINKDLTLDLGKENAWGTALLMLKSSP